MKTERHKFLRPVMVLCLAMALLVSAVVYVASDARDYALATHTAEMANCHGIEALKAEIRTTLNVQLSSLGRKNSVAYAYYTSHPDELRLARKTVADDLAAFGALPCS